MSVSSPTKQWVEPRSLRPPAEGFHPWVANCSQKRTLLQRLCCHRWQLQQTHHRHPLIFPLFSSLFPCPPPTGTQPAGDATTPAETATATSAESGTAAGSGLSRADVAELRAKRAKRQALDGGEGGSVGAPGSAALAKQIMQRELVYDTRASVLCTSGRKFEPVLKLLNEVHRQAKQKAAAATAAGATGADKYERYQQPGQREETGAFDINFRDSYMPGTIFKDAATAAAAASNSSVRQGLQGR